MSDVLGKCCNTSDKDSQRTRVCREWKNRDPNGKLYYFDHNAEATKFFLMNGIPANKLVAINKIECQCKMVEKLGVKTECKDINDMTSFPDATVVWMDGTSTTLYNTDAAFKSMSNGFLEVVLSCRGIRNPIFTQIEYATTELKRRGLKRIGFGTYMICPPSNQNMVYANGVTPYNPDTSFVEDRPRFEYDEVPSSAVSDDPIGHLFLVRASFWKEAGLTRSMTVERDGQQCVVGKVASTYYKTKLAICFMNKSGQFDKDDWTPTPKQLQEEAIFVKSADRTSRPASPSSQPASPSSQPASPSSRPASPSSSENRSKPAVRKPAVRKPAVRSPKTICKRERVNKRGLRSQLGTRLLKLI